MRTRWMGIKDGRRDDDDSQMTEETRKMNELRTRWKLSTMGVEWKNERVAVGGERVGFLRN